MEEEINLVTTSGCTEGCIRFRVDEKEDCECVKEAQVKNLHAEEYEFASLNSEK